MGDFNHDLASEFPEFKDKIHQLKTTNNHFKTLFTRYQDINTKVMRAERREDLVSEAEEEKLRKERLALKDQIFSMLQA